jgi:mannosyltransferase OCH1-like enzyme
MRLANAAERSKDHELEAAALTAIAVRERLQPAVALHLVRKAHSLGQPELAADLSARLSHQVAESRRTEFDTEALLIREGPVAALRHLRRQTGSRARSFAEATLLAKVLASAGENGPARRYLRLCLRRWPNNLALLQQYARACLQSGVPEDGLTLLDRMEAGDAGVDLTPVRLHLLMESGDPESAMELVRSKEALGEAPLQDVQKMRLHLALGQLDEAESLAAAAARQHWRGARFTAHFSISDLGAKLNELRLFHLAMDQGESREALARRFFYPAQQVVEAWLSREIPGIHETRGESVSPVPRRILQYWDRQEVPESVASVMASWSRAEGFEYHRLDRRSARLFLRDRFGADHERAFLLARNAAEECDFLRLCWLLEHGGTYADADDRLTGDPAALLPAGVAMVLYREPYGAIQNNLLSACPGHPVLRFAVEEARQALLRGDNDWTWSKTGPGLLTRAAAAYILDHDEATTRGSLLVLPRHALYRHVHPHVAVPYKSTPAYWNAGGKGPSRSVIEALSRAAREARVNQHGTPGSGARSE